MKIKLLSIVLLLFICFVLSGFEQNLFSLEITWKLTKGPQNSVGAYLNIYALGSTQNGYVFAGTNQAGVFRSSDMGQSWENCSSPLFIDQTISYLVVDSEDNIFVATSLGLFKSSDYGQNWIEMLTGSGYTMFQSVAVGENGLTLAGQMGGIYRSLDYGNNWTFSGLDSCFVWVIKTFNDSIVVGGTANYGPYISMDTGTNWDNISAGLDEYSIIGLAISSTGDLFVGVTDGIFRSTDRGESWERILTSAAYWVGVIFIHQNSLIFAGSVGEGIYLSSDNGNNWDIINSGLQNSNVHSFCGNDAGYVFAGSDSGVYVSSNPVTSVKNHVKPVSSKYLLVQNYPNPFNPVTKIKYQIPELNFVTIKVFDILGNELEALVNQEKSAGSYELYWNAGNLPGGVYFYQLRAGDFIKTKKMILLK